MTNGDSANEVSCVERPNSVDEASCRAADPDVRKAGMGARGRINNSVPRIAKT
jgi:hypothetical protein